MENQPNEKSKIHPTVIALGFASFFTDFSSEMIYPLLPVFLRSILGAGAAALGVIEGAAEFVASLLKILSGIWADRVPKRKPLVVTGYSISALIRPLIGIAGSWPIVLLFRVGDRIGKGIRTSPRDALVADVTDEKSRGAAFGVQRAMDHAGAVVGPLVAAGLIALGFSLRHIFLLAFVPGVLVILTLAFFVKESKRAERASGKVNLAGDWVELGGNFHRVLFAVIIFTLGNSTDAFLLLRMSDTGVKAEWIALLWAFHHMVKVIATTIGGRMSDRVGRRPMIIAGWIYYALIYCAFAFVSSPGWMIAIFMLYGIYYGLTEPTEKAWVTDLVPSKLRGSAFGWYNGAVGLGALPASVLFGAIWMVAGAHVAFITGAALAIIAGIFLMTIKTRKNAGE